MVACNSVPDPSTWTVQVSHYTASLGGSSWPVSGFCSQKLQFSKSSCPSISLVLRWWLAWSPYFSNDLRRVTEVFSFATLSFLLGKSHDFKLLTCSAKSPGISYWSKPILLPCRATLLPCFAVARTHCSHLWCAGCSLWDSTSSLWGFVELERLGKKGASFSIAVASVLRVFLRSLINSWCLWTSLLFGSS